MPNPDPPAPRRGHKLLIASLASLAVAGLGLAVWQRTGDPAGSPLAAADFAEAAIRTFPLEVVASGSLEAKNQLTVSVPTAMRGQATIAEVVPEGTLTQKGDVLCKFNTKELQEGEDRLKLAVASAKAALADAGLSLSLEKENCASAEQAAADKWEAAKTDFKVWEQGTDVQKRRDLNLAIETAARQLEIAERDNKNNHALFAKQFISQSELEKSDIDLLTAREKLVSEKLARRIYEDFNRPKDRREKELAVIQTALANEQAKKQTLSKIAQAQSKCDGARESLQLQEQELKELQAAIADATVRAPQNGIVIYASSNGGWFGDQGPLAPGKVMWRGMPLIVLPDTSQMIANLRVNEAQVQAVKVGQTVSISLSARPGRLFTGRVAQKADTADKDPTNPFLSEYLVKVELPKGIDNDLKPGMSCRGTIATGEVKDALTVPVQAVFTEAGAHHCFVDAGSGQVRKRPVKIGQSGILYTAVTDGLPPGQRVLLRAPLPEETVK